MLLQPRNFVYKKKQKSRSLLYFNSTAHGLRFGGAGLRILRPVQLTAQQIFRFKLFLKRASRKSDYTRRFVWFNAFPHLPLTRKPVGLRMGKGKGKLQCWFTNVSGGTMLIEFRNLRRGRADFFIRQMTHKLGVPSQRVFANREYIVAPLNASWKAPFRAFW